MADYGRGRGRGRGDGSRGRGDGGGRGGRGGVSRGGAFPPGRGGGPPQGGGRGGSDRGGYRGGGDRGGYRGGGDRGRGGGDRGGRGGGRPNPKPYTPPSGGIPVPDAQVKAVEDARQKARKSPNFALSALSLDGSKAMMPSRPGYGTEGAAITVYANYVQLIPKPDLTLYSYDISGIKPEVAGKKSAQVIRLMISEASELADYRNDMVTDFRSTLISRKKINMEGDEMTIVVTYRNEGEDEPNERATQYKVTVKYTKTLSVGDLLSYLTSMNPSVLYENKLDIIQALNIFLKHYAKSTNNLATIGASKTFSVSGNADSLDLGRGLTALRGFFTSVRAATNRVLVNVNVSHGAFYQEGKLTSLMEAFGMRYDDRGMRSLEKFLKRVRVRTTHLKEKKNKKGEVVHRVKAIAALAKKSDGRKLDHPPIVAQFGAGPKNVQFWWDDKGPSAAPASSVPGADPSQAAPKKKGKGKGGKGKAEAAGPQPVGSGAGRYVTVHDHFKNTYGIHTDDGYPVINVGTEQNPSYLPAEVCIVLPGQSAMAKLSGDQTRNMIRFAVRGPWLNAESIVNDGLRTGGLSSQTNPLLAQFGMSVGQSLITVPARVLIAPKVFYKNNKSPNVAFGSWNMGQVQFNKPGNLKTWSWISIQNEGRRPNYSMQELGAVVGRFYQALSKNGVTVQQQPLAGREVTMRFPSDPVLDDVFKAASAKMDLLLVILPGRDKTDNTELYSYIKTLGDTKYGIHTICVVGAKFASGRGEDQYFANVALKFNLKLGGNNQMVDPTHLSFINDDKTMIVGIDVTHPSPGSSDKAPSVAGMVSSIDKYLGQWPGILSVQKARQEMVADLQSMLKTHLGNWKTLGKHAHLPENILVYRDGVSEGQYQTVLDEEVPLLRRACAEAYPPDMTKKNLPRLSVIIVGKRHHTRFYPTKEGDMDRSGNCKPGTVVDRGVTEEGFWDFYLQSHAVLQGTGRPAHYVVVLDEVLRDHAKKLKKADPFAANELEKITQALCYSYSRATKAVSICTPAYHADILCERSRRYMADLFEGGSDEASTVAGSTTGGGEVWSIHGKLKNTMFYV
uniref:Argonaute protein n=1 Tax=Cytospora mali TaxID=578113 RepID=A0A3G1E2G3_CYTMA|nr:argonaute protein [Valsa mali]